MEVSESLKSLWTSVGSYLGAVQDTPSNHNVLGWAIKFPPSGNPGTYPPTDITFQTYPFKGPNQDSPVENIDGVGGFNMLLFKEVTGGRALPTWTLAYGNWVIPPLSGTMAIDSDIFLGKYIAPHLTALNSALDITASLHERHWPDFKFGPQPGTDYAMSRNYDLWRHQWSFLDHTEASDPDYGDRLVSRCDAANFFEYFPGTNKIVVQGSTTIAGVYYENELMIYQTFKMWGKLEWSFSLNLASIHDGGLGLTLTPESPYTREKPCAVTFKLDHDWPKVLDGLKNTPKEMKAQFDKLEKDFADNISQVEANLNKSLDGVDKFYFPGGKTFFFKDPIFNEGGDILVELAYNE